MRGRCLLRGIEPDLKRSILNILHIIFAGYENDSMHFLFYNIPNLDEITHRSKVHFNVFRSDSSCTDL